MHKLVTVGIPLYNHAAYIEQCIRSVLSQDYPNIELIVIDDGSTDNSYAAAKAALDSHTPPPKSRITRRPNVGMCNTLNEIAQQAKGEYISFLGSDDYWLPDKISDQVAYLDAHPEHVLVHSNSTRVDSNGRVLRKMDYSQRDNTGDLYQSIIKRTGGINTPSHLYRTSVYQDIGYYDPAFRFEDTDFWLRLTRNHGVGFIDKTHTCYRWHKKNLSSESNQLTFYFNELIRIYRKNIDEPGLRRYAIRRVCSKGILRSLKIGKFSLARHYLSEWMAA